MNRTSKIALIVFIAAFSLSFLRWVACNAEREVVMEDPVVGLGSEATSDTLAPLLLKRSIEASRPAPDASVKVLSDPLEAPVSAVELEKAKLELAILDREFGYNPFAGFEIPAEQYALFARIHDQWQSERGLLFLAEKSGSLTPDEVSEGLEKVDEKAYAAYQKILGKEKVEMLVTDMREWGTLDVFPKLTELSDANAKE